MIPERVERRARWVLDTLGLPAARLGEDVPYAPEAWELADRGVRPSDDELAQAFFDLARLEERDGAGDAHGRFLASSSTLDPLDPPLDRLRRRLGGRPPSYRGARFAVALTHDVDVPWRWTRIGVRGSAARLKEAARAAHGAAALREARALAAVPVHKVRRSDPNWSFGRVLELERGAGSTSTFFVMAGHRHRADGPSPETYERLRPRLVEVIRARGGEVGLHGSYTAAEDEEVLGAEKRRLEAIAGPVGGQRYHLLRLRPHANLAPLARLGFAYDTSLGFPDAPGFRGGIAHPFRPWDVASDRPLDLIEIPLALMDTTFEGRYLDLPAHRAERVVLGLIEWAAANGGGFAVLWHTNRFDAWTAAGWDRLYARLIEAVRDHGGVCLSARELAEEAGRNL